MKSLRNKLLRTTAESGSGTTENLVEILLMHVDLVEMTLAGDAALRMNMRNSLTCRLGRGCGCLLGLRISYVLPLSGSEHFAHLSKAPLTTAEVI